MTNETKPIIESKNFIILDKYKSIFDSATSYQTEENLELELIEDLQNQGYEYRKDIDNQQSMLENVRTQLQSLNDMEFTNDEWKRFVENYLDKKSDGVVEKTRKIHDDYIHDFVFDTGRIQNIYLIDKKNITRNKVQVIRQFEQNGTHANRYDVTILINGLPLVQIELKKRGVAIREAFNQVNRYSKESFNSENSLYKYLQLFVISNGTDSRYFANTLGRNKNSFDFTMNWADKDNKPIKDLKDLTATFLQKNTLLNLLFNYCVFDIENKLLAMRPYQIAATERILWKIDSSYKSNNFSKVESGGYIWHTTGSGKTLTSFKAAQLATELDFIDKVFFVVDRKDLDYQTMKEYQRYCPDSVNGSNNTAGLKRNMEKDDNKIVVTTIQKLNILMKQEGNLDIYNKQVVFIFDECHRSQFGEAQKNIRKKFKKYCQFGFTGTPIFVKNARGSETTASVFGYELHSYVITNAIRDEKVLKFKVDYNAVRPEFKKIETEQDEIKLNAAENKTALLHPNRISEISQYILNNFHQKTHRLHLGKNGFNAMFAVASVNAAKMYYETIKNLQTDSDKPIKIATIFSFAPNEEQNAVGGIPDESFDVSAMDSTAKDFLSSAINDYNNMFKTNYNVSSAKFQNYYRDLAKRVKSKEVDLLIVVGMFLTGFDAPHLNTLFVDKNLRYHGLLQAYSRTNRILNSTKTFGNIVAFRDLENATKDAITLFGDENTANIVLEKSYNEYMNGFDDNRGFITIINDLEKMFPAPEKIETEADKKEFVKLFGEYLRIESKLHNYDEFYNLKKIQSIDLNDPQQVKEFKEKNYLSDDDFITLQSIEIPTERLIQDYKSSYNDIRDWLRLQSTSDEKNKSDINWDDIVFEVDLLKSQEINLDYILEQIFENNRKIKNKDEVIDDARRLIRASIGHRAKESLIINFINQIDLDTIDNTAGILESFYEFAKAEKAIQQKQLIKDEGLNEKEADRYIENSINRGYASENGMELNDTLPKMSPLNPEYITKKQTVFEKIQNFVKEFKDI